MGCPTAGGRVEGGLAQDWVPRVRLLVDIGPGESIEIDVPATRVLHEQAESHDSEPMPTAPDRSRGVETIPALCDLWLADMLGRYRHRETTAQKSASNVRRVCREIGAEAAEDLTPARLRAWVGERSDLSAGTIQNRMSELCRFADWLVETERLPDHRLRTVRRPIARRADEGPGARALTDAEITRLVEVAEAQEASDGRARVWGPNRSTLYLVLRHTAIRYSEAMRLTWRDVTAEGLIVRGKTGGRRVMPLSAEARAALDLLRENRTKPDETERDRPIFRRVSHHTLARDMARAGIPRRDERGRGGLWHALRKSAATGASARGVSRSDIAGLMGHADERMLDRYIDAPDERAARAIEDQPTLNGVLLFGPTHRNGPGGSSRGEVEPGRVPRPPPSRGNPRTRTTIAESLLRHPERPDSLESPAVESETPATSSPGPLLANGAGGNRTYGSSGEGIRGSEVEVERIARLATELVVRVLRLSRGQGDRRAGEHHQQPDRDGP